MPFPEYLIRVEPFLWFIAVMTVVALTVTVVLWAHRRRQARQFLLQDAAH